VSTIKRILFISAPGQSEASSHPASDRCNKELKTRPGTLVRLHLRDDLPWLAVADYKNDLDAGGGGCAIRTVPQ
jgi:hypothetical protein